MEYKHYNHPEDIFGQQWIWSTAQCRGRAMHRRRQWIFQAVVCGISLVGRAGVCMCWHSPLVLLDYPALANYFLNKSTASSTHLYGNFIPNFLRWKRNKNLQGEIISFCKVMNTDCRSCGMQRKKSLGCPYFFYRDHKHKENSSLQKILRLCLVNTILSWFCMTGTHNK